MAASFDFDIEIDDSFLNSPDAFNLKCKENIHTIDNNCDYNTFFYYMKSNIPCIIKNIGIDWNSIKYWVSDKEPNLSYLSKKYGESTVTVYDCNKKYYNSQETQNTLFKSYIHDWVEMKKKLYYVKDWHLQNEFPDDNFYEVPIYFASDWLNEYLCENNEDDYRFVYVGPNGTWTPFHADVFMSYSWSINICGQKRWLFFPKGEEDKFKDELGNLPYDITNLENCKYFEVVQNPNEAIFVPSGWYHQVWNTKDTISINHNWINGCNVKNVWHSLEQNLIAVENEIEDCKDMKDFKEHCQIMLKASYGIDFAKFYDFLKYIAVKRINFLENDVPVVSFNRYKLGTLHAVFDLKNIEDTLKLFLVNPANLETYINSIDVKNLLSDISKCVLKNKIVESCQFFK